MRYKDIAKEIFQVGREKFQDMEVYIEAAKNIEISVFDGELDKYNVSSSEGLSLRGLANDKVGYSYTEKIDKSSINMLINEAYENGKYIDSVDKEIIYGGSEKYEDMENFNEKLRKTSLENKIEFVKALEKEALSLDSRIERVSYCMYEEMENSKYLINTKGLDLEDRTNLAFAYLVVVAREGEETKTGSSYVVSRDFKDFDYKKMAQEAVEEATSLLGARPIKSDNYPVVFRNNTFANLLGCFTSIFYAENIHKGLSLLKDKLGEKIAATNFTLVEDPFYSKGFNPATFDHEGTATRYKKIIDRGVLKTYLYNWKLASKEGVESTGNGFRDSYKSSISTGTTNLYLEEGDKSFEELVASVKDGVYITDLQGLHSGLNPVSGDFSLSAQGYKIEDGKITRPINQITIAGNFFELLQEIEGLGNDIKVSTLGVGSPSIKIKELSISGE